MQIAAITSKELFNTRLSGRDGSYSQIAVVVSTAAIFVIWAITSTSAKLTTWPKQLCPKSESDNSDQSKDSDQSKEKNLRKLIFLCRPRVDIVKTKISLSMDLLNSFTFFSIAWRVVEGEGEELWITVIILSHEVRCHAYFGLVCVCYSNSIADTQEVSPQVLPTTSGKQEFPWGNLG